MKFKKSVNLLVLSCLIAGGLSAASGQITNATLTGVVTDPSGGALPGAHVSVLNVNTNAVTKVDTNTSGVYVAGQLLPGSYSVTVDTIGFKRSVDTGITLTVGAQATLNVVLQVGDVSQTIEVQANAELINTSSAEISQVVDARAIKELPLNGRNPSSLVLLSTGVTNMLNLGGSQLQGGTTFPTETGASAGGGRQGSTYYLLDGAPNMDTYLLLAAPFPNPDATQEFRVISNNFDSRFGYSPSAVVTIQTRSGTNTLHGGVFEFIRNNDVNAANFFSHKVDQLKRNQFGGFLGGPLLKNRLFLFGNYQATRAVTAAGTNSTMTPTAAMLSGDFTAVPVTAGCNICGKKVNPAGFDPASVKIATTALPLGQDPATGLVNFVGPSNKQNYDEGTARLDYTIDAHQNLFVRSYTNYYLQAGGAIRGNIVGAAILPTNPAEYFNEAMGHNWTINASTVNTATIFWNQLQVANAGQGLDTSGNAVCLSKYVNVTEIPGSCYLEGFSVTSNGFSTNYNQPTTEARTSYGIGDNLTKVLGLHSLTLGGNIWHQFAQEKAQYPAAPIVSFSNEYTGFGLADFLYGYVYEFLQGAGEIASVKGWQYGLFAQDQYRVRPNLTLTLGVRWDPNTPPSSTGGRGAAYRPGQRSVVYPNAPLGLIFPGDPGLNAALIPTTYGYVQPRIGFSWQPRSLRNTVVRGGFGLFTSPLAYSAYNHAADIAPFSPTYTLFGTATNRIQFSNLAAAFPGGKSPFPPFASTTTPPPSNSQFLGPVNVGASFSPNFKLNTTQSWNLSVDQQFGQDFALHIAYVGSETYHLAQIIDLNAGVYTPAANGGVRPNPLYGQILQDGSFGTSPYHSLQTSLEKRYSYGLQFRESFTWSKVIDLAPTGNISFSNGLPDPFDIRHNRGISDLNIPIISVTSLVYRTPSLKGHNLLERAVLGNYEVSMIYTLQTGTPFSIVGGANGSNNSGSFQSGDRADVVPGKIATERQGPRSNWLAHYIPQGTFQPNAPGTFGNSKRNLFTRPYTNTADMTLAKNLLFRERYNLQFRAEAFNALNHTSFGTPNNNPTSSNFGQITAIGPIPPRVVQGAVKIDF